MNTRETRETIEKYYDLVKAGKFEEAGRYQSPDLRRWISGEGSWPFGGWQNSDSMAELHAIIRKRFPKGIQITVEQIIANENCACVNIRNYAERVDGRVYENQIVFLLRIENGLIVEQKEFLDTIMVNELFCGDLIE